VKQQEDSLLQQNRKERREGREATEREVKGIFV